MANSKTPPLKPYRFIASLAVLSLIGIGLLTIRINVSDSMRYVFLVWNLVLAAIPVLLAWWLVIRVRAHGWLKWQQLLLTLVWILFLPNSFYLITDFIHLRATFEASLLYDIVMLMCFVLAGLALGMTSIYMVQRELMRRLSTYQVWSIVGLVLLASSFAITLGRFTRWNSWDILLKPAGLLFDVSDRVVNPNAHGETYLVTATFFILLSAVYWVVWEASRLIAHDH